MLSSRREAEAIASSDAFFVGARVALRGLQRDAMNGEVGTVRAVSLSNGRLGIRLSGYRKSVAVKPENCLILQPLLERSVDVTTRSREQLRKEERRIALAMALPSVAAGEAPDGTVTDERPIVGFTWDPATRTKVRAWYENHCMRCWHECRALTKLDDLLAAERLFFEYQLLAGRPDMRLWADIKVQQALNSLQSDEAVQVDVFESALDALLKSRHSIQVDDHDELVNKMMNIIDECARHFPRRTAVDHMRFARMLMTPLKLCDFLCLQTNFSIVHEEIMVEISELLRLSEFLAARTLAREAILLDSKMAEFGGPGPFHMIVAVTSEILDDWSSARNAYLQVDNETIEEVEAEMPAMATIRNRSGVTLLSGTLAERIQALDARLQATERVDDEESEIVD